MTNMPRPISEEGEVRALIDDWIRAASAKDLDAIMAAYASDIVAFDAIAQLQFKGAEAYRKHWASCLAYMPGPMIFRPGELTVSVGGDVAFVHFLCQCGSANEDGTEKTGWMRGTVCARKSGGQWKIVHEHFSTPFDPESNKAMHDLVP